MIGQNGRIELEKRAYESFLGGKYDDAVNIYAQLIELDSTIKAYYWYLGLCQLLQGRGEEAQMTWLFAIENVEFELIDQLTTELCKVLDKEAQKQSTLGSNHVAITIRNCLQALNPYNFANLISIILLSIELGTFTSELLVDLELIDLLKHLEDSGEFQPLELKALLELFDKIFTYASLDPKILKFIESICLAHLQFKPEIIENLLCVSENTNYNANIATAILEICLKLDSKNIKVLASFEQMRMNHLLASDRKHEPDLKLKGDRHLLMVEAESQNTHGIALAQQGNLAAAIHAFQSAISLNPDYADAYYNLGVAFGETENIEASVNCYHKALQIKPDHKDASWNFKNSILSNVAKSSNNNLKFQRRLADHLFEYFLESDKVRALVNLINNYTHSGLSDAVIDRLIELEDHIFENLDRLTDVEVEVLYLSFIFILSSLRDSPEKNSQITKLIGEIYVERIIKSKLVIDAIENVYRNFAEEKACDLIKNQLKIDTSLEIRHLRIGFLSRNFSRHAVGWCSFDVIHELSKITPHVYLYGSGEMELDDRTHMFESIAEKFYWSESSKLAQSDNKFASILAQVINDISQDNLDVLIDLDSLTTPLNMHILHRQLAPVCISWLGFDAPYISSNNYWLGDWHTHPTETEKHYIEKIVRLPDSHMAIAGFDCVPTDRERLREDLGISSKQVAYLFAAAGRKFNRDTAKACIEILKNVPNSILLYKGSADFEVISSIYEEECVCREVDYTRIKFLPSYKTEEEHRSSYLIADIFLDSYPYNGGSHSLEALWFNLPFVTRIGKQSFARMGYSFLQSVRIAEGIATNWEEYVEWSIRFGLDNNLRNSIRNRLIQSKLPETLAPLWNPQKLANDMYNLLATLVRER